MGDFSANQVRLPEGMKQPFNMPYNEFHGQNPYEKKCLRDIARGARFARPQHVGRSDPPGDARLAGS